MSTDRDCFIPTTETSSLSHKGMMPVGIEQAFFFFFGVGCLNLGMDIIFPA